MASKRMMAKIIIDSDAFLDMPQTTQNLYFHLNMRADDEGFIDNPKKIMRTIGAGQNDIDILLAKRYLLRFESGVIVIKHWKLHNCIRKDRLKPTVYQEEKSKLFIKKNGVYTDNEEINLLSDKILSTCQSNVSQVTDNCLTDCQSNVGVDQTRLDLDKVRPDIDKDCAHNHETKETKEEDIFKEDSKPAKRYTHSRKRIDNILTYSHGMKSLPDERRILENISNAGEIADSLSFYSQEEIKQALDNYEICATDSNTYKIHPYSNIINFIINNGIQKFTNASDPLKKFKINGKSEIVTDFEVIEF